MRNNSKEKTKINMKLMKMNLRADNKLSKGMVKRSKNRVKIKINKMNNKMKDNN